MRIAFGQFNATVGDLSGNEDRMYTLWQQAMGNHVDLLVFPELCLCGYPPEDLLHKAHFVSDNRAALKRLADKCVNGTLVLGLADGSADKIYNAAAVIQDGRIGPIYRKGRLPNFSVFDEARYFHAGTEPVVVSVNDLKVALTICYDLWDLSWLTQWVAPVKPFDLLLNISASPFDVGKIARREKLISQCAQRLQCAVGYCNLVGGQDELVFDGRSMLAGPDGIIVTRAKAFQEDLLIADIAGKGPEQLKLTPVTAPAASCDTLLDETYGALVLGTRDYVHKNGFKKVCCWVSAAGLILL